VRAEEERRGEDRREGEGMVAPPQSGEPWICLCPTPEGPKLL